MKKADGLPKEDTPRRVYPARSVGLNIDQNTPAPEDAEATAKTQANAFTLTPAP